jgi:hypothetical protein
MNAFNRSINVGTRISETANQATFSQKVSRKGMRLLLFTFASAIGTAGLSAQTWTGNGDGSDWFDAANWDPQVVPGNAAVVIGLSDTEVVIDSANTAASTVSTVISATSAVAPLLTVRSDLTSTGSTFTVGATNGSGRLVQESGAVSLGGTVFIGNNTGGTGNYTLNGGTAAVTGSLRLGQSAGTGTFEVNAGTLTARDAFIGREANSNGSLIQTGGTINFSTFATFGHNASNASGSFIQTGGTASTASFYRVGQNGVGYLQYHGSGLDVGTDFAVGHSTGSVGTVDFRIGSGVFNAITAGSGFLVAATGAEAHLRVGLQGGVALRNTNEVTLVAATGSRTGNGWTSLPGANDLWNVTTDTNTLIVSLNPLVERGAQALQLGDSTAWNGDSFSVGYVNLDVAALAQLGLGLNFDPDTLGAGSENLMALVEDLTAAGYAVSQNVAGYDVILSGLNQDSASYFAWDFSDYNAGDTLALGNITVIPEPGTTALVMLLAVAAFVVVRRRK